MAGRSSLSMSMVTSHRLFAPTVHPVVGGAADHGVELDEADVIWGSGSGGGFPASSSPSSGSFLSSSAAAADPYARSSPPVAAPSSAKQKPRGGISAACGGAPGPASSVPVNIPDWSKILGAEYAGSARGWAAAHDDAFAGDDDFAAGAGSGGRRWVPPHEVVQGRERAAASFSVREGAGRTLKGRDLRRVRNAIWEKTGFQD